MFESNIEGGIYTTPRLKIRLVLSNLRSIELPFKIKLGSRVMLFWFSFHFSIFLHPHTFLCLYLSLKNEPNKCILQACDRQEEN